jgi:hypothetical protein
LIRKGNGEASIQKAVSVVKHTWELMYDTEARLHKMSQAASKINNPKSRAYQMIWDIPYLHQFVHELPVPAHKNTIAYMERAIMVIRGLTGWRSADLLGLFAHHSMNFVDDPRVSATHGVHVSLFDTKSTKNKWTAPVFFPRLHDDYASLCVYRLMRDIQIVVDDRNVAKIKILERGSSKSALATPLMICQNGSRAKFKQMSGGTVRNYFGRAFLDNVQDGDKGKYSASYAAHSCRHAAASALAEMGNIAVSISRLTLNSPAALEQSYIMPVERTWDIPQACVDKQKYLCVKLLVPYVHWHSTQGDSSKKCACDKLVQQMPPPPGPASGKHPKRSRKKKK